MDRLPELIAAWAELREQRLELEHLADEIKNGPEAAASDSVLAWLASSGLKHAACPGLGTAAIRRDIRVDVEDHALMANHLRNSLNEAHERGEPLLDRLCLQRRAAQGSMLDHARAILERAGHPKDAFEDIDKLNNILKPLGFVARGVESLHFTKERTA